jgi:hypothetical protein
MRDATYRARRRFRQTVKRVRRARLLRTIPKGSECVEIGVWRGDFSQQILEVTRPRRLVLIDPWQYVPGTNWYGRIGSQERMDALHEFVANRFNGHGQVEIVRARSADAASAFPDGSLDWVYVDGDHSYEGARDDLRTYAAKVRPGGLLAGDDYRDVAGRDGVKRAVDEFLQEKRGELVLIRRDQFVLRVNGRPSR